MTESGGLKTILSVDDVYAAYIKKQVLNGVTITVREGEIVALIGPNGAGKSTVLKVITGFLKPQKGRVEFYGEDITQMEVHERIVRGIGYFMQGGEVFKSMTIEENLEMGSFTGQAPTIREGRAESRKLIDKDRIYDLFPNLKDKRKRPAGLLSGGEKQALALGMVLMTCPRLLLLDEPSAGLSPSLVKEVLEKIVKINTELGIEMLIVEQNVREVLNIVHRVYVMKLGKIVGEEKPQTLLMGKALEEVFLRG